MTPIATHFEMLMPLEEQERIGATADKDESTRVMRTLSHYNELREAIIEYVAASRVNMPANRAPLAWTKLCAIADGSNGPDEGRAGINSSKAI